MDNNFEWNLGRDFIAHYGTPRHSGRYPWGSGAKNGKTPIHEHGEKKHKTKDRVDKSKTDDVELFGLVRKSERGDDLTDDEKSRMYDLLNKKYGRAYSMSDMDINYQNAKRDMNANRSETKNDNTSSSKNEIEIPAGPVTKQETTGSFFNKKTQTVLTEAGKKLRMDVTNKTASFYDKMSKEDLAVRQRAYEKFKKASEDYEKDHNGIEGYQKYKSKIRDHQSLMYGDMDKILDVGSRDTNINGRFGGHRDAYELARRAFEQEYQILLENNFLEHSDMTDMTDEDAAWEELLNTPIN